jgi:FixJ family two-component response regulator
LIVDDDETDLRAVRRHLRHGYSSATLDAARTASAALKQIASTPYDCLLLDYYLPDAHDLSLVLRIQQLAPALPIVMFTGRGDEDIAVDLMKAGVADYVPKSSVTSERLAAAVRHALAMAQAAQKQREADAELRRALAEAEAATAAKSRLLAVISHDLRQPLQVLVSAHNGLKRAVKGQPAYEKKLDLATLATRRLIGAVDKIAQIARLQSGAIVPNRQAFAVQTVLLELEEIGREQARPRSLEFAVSPCEAWVESDPDMLRSILENLAGSIGWS